MVRKELSAISYQPQGVQLEICANSIRSALAAQEGGADRIELCDNLREGGTTPSYGTIKRCLELLTIPVFVLIRPHGGDFCYTSEEFEVMKYDIIHCRDAGCEGVVLGILHADGTIDFQRCRELIALARPMQVTFHRAFDACVNQERSLEEVIALGCEWLLTSGGGQTAYEGIDLISKLVQQAAGRIAIMPGAGVSEENVAEIVRRTGVCMVHGSASVMLDQLTTVSSAIQVRTMKAALARL